MFRRAVRKVSGTHAKNYIQDIANDRLNRDVIPRVKTMLANADKVDSADILYFSRSLLGTVCSCQHKTAFVEQSSHPIANENMLTRTGNNTIKVKHHGVLFGEHNTDEHIDNEFPVNAEQREWVDDSAFIFNESKDCGVCYRSGFIPPYILIGAQSSTITANTGHVVEYDGYVLDEHTTPEKWVKLRDDGYIKFSCALPPVGYITRLYYTIRNDYIALTDDCLLDRTGLPIINLLQVAINCALDSEGNNMFTFYIRSDEITHIAIHAFTGDLPYANISDESYNLDYNTLNSLSNLTLTIPTKIPKVDDGDIIFVPSRNLTLKVVSHKHADTIKHDFWEYTVDTRQIQPQENLISLPLFKVIEF
jgi:hypothetical protein